MLLSDFRIQNHDKLDRILVDLCGQVIKGQKEDPDYYGMVAAAVLDPDNNIVASTSSHEDGKWIHAERNAIDAYLEQYGEIPPGSIIITTLSPCTEYGTDMANERYGTSCTDLINQSGVHKVYAGYADPSQDETRKQFHLKITTNPRIQQLCKQFADTFLKDKLDELSFLGSQCTKDCSGHRAGYEWSKRKGLKQGNSPWSPSFNKGAALAVAGK